MPKARARDGVYYRSDRRSWWVSYTDADGQRQRVAVAAHTRPQAVAARAALMVKAERDKALGVKPPSETSTHDLLARFERYQRTRLRPTTYQRLGGILRTLEANLPALAKDITRNVVSGYVDLRSETVAPGTVHKEVAALKRCFNLAVKEWELFQRNPAAGVQMPTLPQGRTRFLSPSEFKAALEAAPGWMKLPIALAVATGMRRGELLSLCWKDVDLEGRRLYLRETKNGTLRIHPLSDPAFRLLVGIPQGEPSNPVLIGVDEKKLSVYTRRLFAGIGIRDASFHTLRHTYASWMVMQGVDLYTVGQLLGHKTARMTQRYAHLSPDYMAGAVGRLDTVFSSILPPGDLHFVTIASPPAEPEQPTSPKLLN